MHKNIVLSENFITKIMNDFKDEPVYSSLKIIKMKSFFPKAIAFDDKENSYLMYCNSRVMRIMDYPYIFFYKDKCYYLLVKGSFSPSLSEEHSKQIPDEVKIKIKEAFSVYSKFGTAVKKTDEGFNNVELNI